jgi:hypothetical protein
MTAIAIASSARIVLPILSAIDFAAARSAGVLTTQEMAKIVPRIPMKFFGEPPAPAVFRSSEKQRVRIIFLDRVPGGDPRPISRSESWLSNSVSAVFFERRQPIGWPDAQRYEFRAVRRKSFEQLAAVSPIPSAG